MINPKNLFERKYKLGFDKLYSVELPEPKAEAGEQKVVITDCTCKEYYGKYEGAKKYTLKFRLQSGLIIEKDYFVNNGIGNELASLAGELFTEYKDDELDVRDFIGKSLYAIITYSYNNFCQIEYNLSNYKSITE